MKNWWQKSIIIAVAVLTLGAIPPSHMLWESLLDEKASSNPHAEDDRHKQYIYDWQDPSEYYYESRTILDTVHKAAEEQAYMKFGSRVGPVISDEFQSAVLPNMQRAIDMYLAGLDSSKIAKLAISEKPSGDHSEKIFHIYDIDTDEDAIRFHVRTEKKPKEGYFFNFHYHVADDDFQQHITLGDIYWSKNTPPKWLS